MSEGSAEGGGDIGSDIPLQPGQFTGTAQNPGSGIFAPGWYSWGTSQRGAQRPERPHKRKKRRKKR